MNNAEVITGLRECATVGDCSKCKMHDEYSYDMCVIKLLLAAADALEADEKRISDLEDDLRTGMISDPERFKIYNYSLKDLILFADMCKRNNVRDADLKQAAWNLELAVRAVMNERQEIAKNMLDEITMRFTPNFEEAYKEMMENCVLPHVKGEKNEN